MRAQTEEATKMEFLQDQEPLNFEAKHAHRAKSAPMHRARLGEMRKNRRLVGDAGKARR